MKRRIVGTPMVGDSDLSKTREPGGPADNDEDLDNSAKSSRELWPTKRGYSFQRTLLSAPNWYVFLWISLHPVTLELLQLLNSDLETSIGPHWMLRFESQLLDVKYGTELRNPAMLATQSTCHCCRLVHRGKESPWILSRTSRNLQNRDLPASQ